MGISKPCRALVDVTIKVYPSFQIDRIPRNEQAPPYERQGRGDPIFRPAAFLLRALRYLKMHNDTMTDHEFSNKRA
jgi:hypothetical protein